MKKIFTNTIVLLQPTERRYLYWYILLDLFIILADIGSLVLLLYIINFYTRPIHPGNKTPIIATPFYNDHFHYLLIAFFLFLFACKNFFAYYIHQRRFRFLYSIATRISQKNLLQYLEGNYSNYVLVDSAVQIRRISQEPIEFSHYVLAGILQIITQSILIFIAIVSILLYNASLFLVLFAILLPPIFLVAYFIKKRTRSARSMAKKNSENTLQFLKEALSGFVEANIYGKKDFFVQRYAAWQQKLNTQLSSIQSAQAIPNRVIEVFAVAGLFTLITINQLAGSNSTNSVINIGAFMAAAYKIMPAIVQIINNNGQVKTYAFTVADLLQKNDVTSNTAPDYETINIQSIKFSNIHFNYGDQKIVSGLNTTITKGDFVGVAGKSGKGKTTIINLLLGFLESACGEILINDLATNAISRTQYWKQITYVKQQPFLIHDTLLSNITLNETRYNRERLAEVIRITGLDDFIKRLPNGLNTTIAENGKNISGGQRQRIAIARALYKEADLIILDEPFNELDRNSESFLLQEFIQLAADGKIIILITHNKESLAYCNKIIYPDEQ